MTTAPGWQPNKRHDKAAIHHYFRSHQGRSLCRRVTRKPGQITDNPPAGMECAVCAERAAK